MTTRLDKPLKREITIHGQPYVVTISPDGVKLTVKGRRKGQELRWDDLVSGEAALAVALNASLRNAGGAQVEVPADARAAAGTEAAADTEAAAKRDASADAKARATRAKRRRSSKKKSRRSRDDA